MSIYKSPFPDVDVHDQEHVARLILDRAKRHFADRVAMVCAVSGREVTYAQLCARVHRVCSALTARGLRPGHVVAVFSPNCPEYVEVLLGVLLAGGVITTASHLYTQRELLHQLKDTSPKFLFCHENTKSIAHEVHGHLPSIQEVFIFGPTENASGFTQYEKLLSSGTSDPPPSPPECNPKDDVILIPYSSGTTGVPKGVMLTHANIVANFYQSDNPYTRSDVRPGGGPETYLVVLPVYHMYALAIIVLFGLFKGNKLVIVPRFDVTRFLQAIETHRVTVLHLVPPICVLLPTVPDLGRWDLSSLHLAMVAAAPLKQAQAERLRQALSVSVRQAYGMTELSPIVTMAPIENWKDGEAGVLVPNTECKVVDVETGKLLGNNQDGELWFRGPQVMKGYWKNPSATSATIDKDGFLHTGDIGHWDSDGHLFVVDRLKELIKYNAFQVAPAELEAMLLGHEDVVDAGVIGVPDARAGELPRGYVVLRKHATCTAADIVQFVAERVAPHKKLRGGVVFVDQIPKSASGKILRRVMKDQFLPKSKL